MNLIIDKNVIIGTNENRLREFAKAHKVIIPHTAFLECLISTDLVIKRLFRRIDGMIRNGANVSYQVMQIVEAEGKSLSPCKDIIDYEWSSALRRDGIMDEQYISEHEIARRKDKNEKIANDLKKMSIKVCNKYRSRHNDKIKELRGKQKNFNERITDFFNLVNKSDTHDLAIKQFQILIKNPVLFCLSDEWLSWHYMRLLHIMALEYASKKVKGELPNIEKIENDCMDIEYIVLLFKADGLITNDIKCGFMAKAAFPEKYVFSSIEEASGIYDKI